MRTHYFAISITISLWDTGADNSVPESQRISKLFTNPFDQFNQKSYSFTNMTFTVDTPDMIAKKYQGKWFLGWCMVISMSNKRLSVMFSTVTVIAAVIYSMLFIEKLAFILFIYSYKQYLSFYCKLLYGQDNLRVRRFSKYECQT